MPRFSTASNDKLDTCIEPIQELLRDIVKIYDCTIVFGHRTKEEQNEAFRIGNSKVEWPNSKHNVFPSLAVDVAPYPIRWRDTKAFYHFAGYVMAMSRARGLILRWGGDWDSDLDLNDQTFMDLAHFEVRRGKK